MKYFSQESIMQKKLIGLLLVSSLMTYAASAAQLSCLTNIMSAAKFEEIYPTDATKIMPGSCTQEKINSGGCTFGGEDPATTKKNYSKPNYYTYANLEKAFNNLFVAQNYVVPFCSSNSLNNYRELAAFLANINQETNGASPPSFNADGSFTATGAGAQGAGYGLTTISEGDCAGKADCSAYGTKQGFCQNTDKSVTINGACGNSEVGFCQQAKIYCHDGVAVSSPYYGRGAKQLTYAYNYVFYGSKINPSAKLQLANNPNLLNSDGALGWATGLAYWSIPFEEANGSKKPSMHEGMFAPTHTGRPEFDNEIGFGKTINIINGGVECGKSNTSIKGTTLNRINSYIELMIRFDPSAIKNVVVTKNDGSTNTFDNASLRANIKNNLIKKYKGPNGNDRNSDYSDYQPSWTKGKWANGKYNSFALLQEYYFAPDTVKPSDGPNLYNNGTTKLKKIVMNYTNGTSERLDCSGIMNNDGK
ncbi:MAG: hypothetical protein E6Q32_00390 [Neisseriales bacterium]|nr:MAG: hypothetical protein E6Q32_00390 [Neisseriales bacterium]